MADQCKQQTLYIGIIFTVVVLAIVICSALVYYIVKLRRRRNDYQLISGNGNEDLAQKYKELYEEEVIKKGIVERQLDMYKDRYNEEKREKEDALQRLSKIMSDRLTDGNPNIANLSDCKRPTKLAEELSELYDNEWTVAFESIKNENDEEKIGLLLNSLQIAFGWCKLNASSQVQKMKNLLVYPDMLEANTGDSVSVNLDMMKRFKDERKLVAEKTVSYVAKKVLTTSQETYKGSKWETAVSQIQFEEYCKKCAEVCWYMAIQDPPMDMKFSDFKFDDFKPYTQSGKQMKYVVWPPLYLQEKGNLMSKGVAQFTPKI